MNVYEARDAFIKTIESIVEPLSVKGLLTDIRCFFSDRDLIEIPDENAEKAAVLAAEIRIVDPKSSEEIAMETAVAIEDGEILNDEIAREATTLRQSVQEILDALEDPITKSAFDNVLEDEEPEQEYPTFDNRMYYIIGTIVVIIVIIAVAFF